MKNSSLGMKLLMAAVTLAVLAYFGMQGYRYFADPALDSNRQAKPGDFKVLLRKTLGAASAAAR